MLGAAPGRTRVSDCLSWLSEMIVEAKECIRKTVVGVCMGGAAVLFGTWTLAAGEERGWVSRLVDNEGSDCRLSKSAARTQPR